MLSSYSVHSASPLYTHSPSTPTRSATEVWRYQPRNSSPLVLNHSPAHGSSHRTSSPPAVPMSSPTTAAQERRRTQYKSLVSCRTPEASSAARRLFSSGAKTAACSSKRSAQAFFSQIASTQTQDPAKLFLREQFQARCRERARQARQRAVSEKRVCSSDAGGFGSGIGDEEMDCDDEETDEDVMQDELFRRIMQSTTHRTRHAYRLSYSLEVGSSFDPDLEDVNAWESELKAGPPPSTSTTSLSPMSISTPPPSIPLSSLKALTPPTSSSRISTSTSNMASSATHSIPDDIDDEELQAYAEEYTIFADFADIDPNADEFSSLSDLEELEGGGRQQYRDEDQDRDMDIS
ncbi:hypothetical protein V8B97DRAFT_825072 [Scleroderma yunnanense]